MDGQTETDRDRQINGFYEEYHVYIEREIEIDGREGKRERGKETWLAGMVMKQQTKPSQFHTAVT